MADKVELVQTSAEEVAYKLYREVMGAEKYPEQKMQPEQARKYLLDLYAECINATKGHRNYE